MIRASMLTAGYLLAIFLYIGYWFRFDQKRKTLLHVGWGFLLRPGHMARPAWDLSCSPVTEERQGVEGGGGGGRGARDLKSRAAEEYISKTACARAAVSRQIYEPQ